ncbi:MAG: nucleoside deaminase [Candidatus Eisenbacteria sp.]|nr:nucleoside deaminase [Candidatus Eisenbacteria bacterium]
MRLALEQAQLAADKGEVPIGCILAGEGRILGRGHNCVETLQDPTAHAEILAISAAAGTLGSWRLIGVTAYVTVEPCMMCMGAFYQARLDRVVFGAREPKFGACGSRLDLTQIEGLNHTVRVEGGLLADEAAGLLQLFFRSLRDETT